MRHSSRSHFLTAAIILLSSNTTFSTVYCGESGVISTSELTTRQPLVGDWIQVQENKTDRLIFNQDGTGSQILGAGRYVRFRWTTTGAQQGTILMSSRMFYVNYQLVSLPPAIRRPFSLRNSNHSLTLNRIAYSRNR